MTMCHTNIIKLQHNTNIVLQINVKITKIMEFLNNKILQDEKMFQTYLINKCIT